MKIFTPKKGKNKGKSVRSYIDDFGKHKSKYRKVKPNRFHIQKRFLSQLDLAEMKKMEAISNSQIKRGERQKGNWGGHYVCGCGVEGCVGYNEHTTTK
jgi:hypothetical protein